MSRWTSITLLALLLFPAASALADCLPYQRTVDTIAPGTVRLTVCFPFSQPPTCSVDTITERQLLDTLIMRYRTGANVAVARIDSVISYTGDYIRAESAHVTFDAVLKGTVPAPGVWLPNQIIEDEWSYTALRGKQWIAFVNDFGGAKRLIDPGFCDETGFGYYLENGSIANRGYNALYGVSAGYRSFLEAVLDTCTISNNSIMCFAAPCPNFTVTGVTTRESRNVDAVRDTAGRYLNATDPVIKHSYMVRGYFVPDSLSGWVHGGTTFVITDIIGPTGIIGRSRGAGNRAAFSTIRGYGNSSAPAMLFTASGRRARHAESDIMLLKTGSGLSINRLVRFSGTR